MGEKAGVLKMEDFLERHGPTSQALRQEKKPFVLGALGGWVMPWPDQ